MRTCLFAATFAVAFASAAWAQPAGPAVTVKTLTDTDGVHPGDAGRAAVLVTIAEGWHVNAHEPLDEFLVPTSLRLTEPADLTAVEVVYPEPAELAFSWSDEVILVYGGTFVIGVAVAIPEDLEPGTVAVKGVVRYQACNDATCAAPTTLEFEIPFDVVSQTQAVAPQHAGVFDAIVFSGAASTEPPVAVPTPAPAEHDSVLLADFAVAGQAGGYMRPDAFIAFIDAAETGTGSSQANFLEGMSVWLVILITVGGGVLLNLTPCVLPMIPINLGIIGAGAQSGSRSRGFVLGGLYGLAIALTYGVLGLVVVLTAGAFGGINATPWFNLAIAIVFVVLGLAMFDVIVIDFSRFQSKVGVKKPEAGSYFLAFFLGFVNALLAGACVAPVVIMVILYSQDAYAKGSVAALGLPFLLGVGMALPWPLAGGGLSFLPKPGAWMVRVKQAFGVFILAMAGYYGHQGVTLFSDRYLVDPEAVRASAEAADEDGWISSLSEGLAQAKRENKPVIVDFWATWCKNCGTMNATTLKDPEVKTRLDGYVKVKYQAQDPTQSPARDVLDHFDEYVGLPHYAILKPPAS